MTRRAWWTVTFLTVTATAVGMELWASADASPDTVPWTDLIGENIPESLAMAGVALLVTWLPQHFAHRYAKRKGNTMSIHLDPNVEHPAEPLLTRALVVAAATVILNLVVAFGLRLSAEQRAAILGVANVAVPLALAWWARRHVYSPATVARLLLAARGRR